MIAPTDTPPSKAETRRQQILDAACDCVRQAGFHGASMAEIAKSAGLSVGQIYRYFANKEAIIAAIVEQDHADIREKFSALSSCDGGRAEALIAQCDMALQRNYDSSRTPLVLEILAEAARNPNVAAIVRKADVSGRALVRALLEESRPEGVGEAELAARGEILSMLFEGMVVRSVLNPEGDRAAMVNILKSIWRQLLVGPPLIRANVD